MSSGMRGVEQRLWTPREVEQLKAWRAEGVGNAEVARRLGRGHHGIADKVRKLKLPPLHTKPTAPVKPRVHAAPEAPRAGKHTLPPLRSLSEGH